MAFSKRFTRSGPKNGIHDPLIGRVQFEHFVTVLLNDLHLFEPAIRHQVMQSIVGDDITIYKNAGGAHLDKVVGQYVISQL
ncbi:hypothetical protein GC387_31115 [Pseudomonas sp. MWU12-2323]|nr:hypothetical protein [Pseudomonas sp. MWU12-2323]